MSRIPDPTWSQIRTAYASGIGLRELARNMGIPEGTVLARANREGWTEQIENAKALRVVKRDAITPMQSAAISISNRKAQLLGKTLQVANKAIDRMDDQIGTANISQATIAFGVSLDKATQLAGEPTHHVAISLNPVDIYAELREVQAAIIEAVRCAPALPAIEV